MDPASARRTPPPPWPFPARRLIEPSVPDRLAQPQLPFGEAEPETSPTPEVDPALQRRATSLVGALVDVLRRRRPAVHLQGWVSPPVAALLAHLSAAHLTGLRLCSVRFQMPSPGVVEGSARVHLEGSYRAVALRFVGDGSHLVCTHLELSVLPPAIHRAGAPVRLGSVAA